MCLMEGILLFTGKFNVGIIYLVDLMNMKTRKPLRVNHSQTECLSALS